MSAVGQLSRGTPSRRALRSPHDPPIRSIVDVFWKAVAARGADPALRWRVAGAWQTLSWQDYGRAVRVVATRLAELGVSRGDRVGILSGNRWEWHVSDLATMSLGAVTVPIYQTNAAGQVARAVSHSRMKVCLVDGPEQLTKVLLRRGDLRDLERICTFTLVPGLDDDLVLDASDWFDPSPGSVTPSGAMFDERSVSLEPSDLATLVYTSGTTGPPKGTMLTHGNIAATLENVTSVVPIGPDDRFLSFLPLSHIAERAVSHFGQIVSGGQTWFARDLASVPADIRECRPTVFFAVPRVWEKMRDGVLEELGRQPDPLRRVAERYLDDARRRGVDDGAPFAQRALRKAELLALDNLLGRQICGKLGLGEAHFLVSGAAPISRELLEWFEALGLPIAEVYGQTEGCGVAALNPPGAIRYGTVGPAVSNIELRIADDNEILVRGRAVSPGYLDDPAATSELIDTEGWMHTGDLGTLDSDGYLTVTGRKKDLIVTSSGKNISPQEIETALQFEPLISQAIIVGDDRPYLVALLSLDPDAVNAWADERGRPLDGGNPMEDDGLLAEVHATVERINAKHARIEGIKRWRLLPQGLSIESGELTPTLKVKREAVTRHHADLVEEMYAAPQSST